MLGEYSRRTFINMTLQSYKETEVYIVNAKAIQMNPLLSLCSDYRERISITHPTRSGASSVGRLKCTYLPTTSKLYEQGDDRLIALYIVLSGHVQDCLQLQAGCHSVPVTAVRRLKSRIIIYQFGSWFEILLARDEASRTVNS